MALNNGLTSSDLEFGPMSDAKSVMEVVNSLAKITVVKIIRLTEATILMRRSH